MTEQELKQGFIEKYLIVLGDGFELVKAEMLEDLTQLLADLEQSKWKKYPENKPQGIISYLVLTKYGSMDVCRYSRKSWVNDMRPQHSNGDVIAYRELPELYKPE